MRDNSGKGCRRIGEERRRRRLSDRYGRPLGVTVVVDPRAFATIP
jgi:hypothetical protein